MGEAMRFTLYYRGELKANARPDAKHSLRRHFHRRAIFRGDRQAADQVADFVGAEIGACQHRDYAGRSFRGQSS